MNYLERFEQFWRGTKKSHVRLPSWGEGQGKAEQWGEFGPDLSYAKAAERYEQSDLVFMCIKRLSDMAADSNLLLFPKKAERDPSTGLPQIEDAIETHEFYDLWDSPNPQDSKAEFLEAIVTTLLLSPKGVFIHLDDGQRPTTSGQIQTIDLGGRPVALWWLMPEFMKPEPGKMETFIDKFVFKVAGAITHFDPEAIMWIKEFNPRRPYASVSRLQPIDLASTTDLAAQRSDLSLFKNAMRPSAIIQTDSDVVDLKAVQEITELWEKRYTGPENWHKLFPLWAGFKFQQFGLSPADAQSDETSKRNRMRIFGVFGVHPGLILSEDVNLANAKVAEYVTRAFTLKPLLRRVADEITMILPLWGRDDIEAHFVGVVPQDEQTDAEVERIKAVAAKDRSAAMTELVDTFGFEAGVTIAKDWHLVPEDMPLTEPEKPPAPEPVPPQLQQPMMEQQEETRYWPGWKNEHHISPVLPAVPLQPVRISEADIDRALAEFYKVFPDLTGILEAGKNGSD